MAYIVCLKPLIPIRKEANHRSEQVSQLLFGECAAMPETHGEWSYIRSLFDDYSGWVEAESVTTIDESYITSEKSFSTDPLTRVTLEQSSFLIPCGSEIPIINNKGLFTIGITTFSIENTLGNKPLSPVETALKFLHAPYLWGGRTIMGIDCSGLTQIAFKVCGIALPRDASKQVVEGTAVTNLHEAQPGDLCFFGDKNNAVTHVGIYLADDQIIHASKSVRIDPIDSRGIFNRELGKYTHTMHCIRRIH